MSSLFQNFMNGVSINFLNMFRLFFFSYSVVNPFKFIFFKVQVTQFCLQFNLIFLFHVRLLFLL